MKIAVNARMLTQRKPGGIKTYAHETLTRITWQHPEHEFLFIVDRPFSGRADYPAHVQFTQAFPSFHPLLWHPWFEMALPRIMNGYGADLLLSLDGFVCLSSGVPAVVVIHDLNFHHHPQDMPFLISRYYRRFFPRYAKKAKMIATVSEYSKQDLIHVFGESPDKIIVTYCGVNGSFSPLPEEEKESVRKKITDGAPYFLSVGTLHPRKNTVRLLEAFEKFKRETGSQIKLVFAGPPLFKTKALFQTWRRLRYKNDILFLGTVSDERLREIYGAAHALVFVSYFEGFGLPALEAMGCNVPVLAGDRTSLPEICGDAACFVNPFSVDAIADAMKRICFDETLRKNLMEKGRARIKFFSWDQTADLLWKAVERGVS